MNTSKQLAMEKKDCMFQYATDFKGWGGVKIYEDTGLITFEEAKSLWNKYIGQARKEAEDDDVHVQICIWVDCGAPTNYHKTHPEYDFDSFSGSVN